MRTLPDDTVWAAKAPPDPDAADAGDRIRYELGCDRASGEYWLSISHTIGRNSTLTDHYRISRADAERLADQIRAREYDLDHQ